MKLMCIFDSKAMIYSKPIPMLSTGEAVRGFVTTLNDGQSDYSLYPADFTLFEMGSFDPQSGKFDIYAAPENLGNGLALKTNIPQHKAN